LYDVLSPEKHYTIDIERKERTPSMEIERMKLRLHLDEPAVCQIRVQGSLAQHWSEYLGGLSIAVADDAGQTVTTLTGEVLDQAALMGILTGLYGMGYPLLSVECQSLARKEANQATQRDRQ
jgi:hypothetical protein